MDFKGYFLDHFFEYLKRFFPFIIVIIIVDLLPLLALYFWDWSAIEAIYLYALETIILFWFALRKMRHSRFILALFPQHYDNVVTGLDKSTTINLRAKVPLLSFLMKGARSLLFLAFIFVWIPLIIIQMMIISWISDDGFELFGFVSHDAGNINLGLFSVDIMLLFLLILYLEHSFSYKTRFKARKEYENTGLINEGIIFSLRVIIQQSVIIGLFGIIGVLHVDNDSMIVLIILKTIFDIFSYITIRIWGEIKNKIDAKRKEILVEN